MSKEKVTQLDNGKNPELKKLTEEATRVILASLEKEYGVFSYKKDGAETREMPLALADGNFQGYPEGAFANFTTSQEKLPFHNRNHTEKVILRIKEMCRMINQHSLETGNPQIIVTQDVENILILAAVGHDTKQENTIKVQEKTAGSDQRYYQGGDNETNSALNIKGITEKKLRPNMPDADQAEKLLSILETAILETRAEKKFGPGTIQQQFDNTKPWQAHLVAFADIGGAGMNPETFITEGDALLLEVFPFVLKKFQEYSDGQEIPEDIKTEVVTRVRNWDQSQITWAKGREQKFNQPWTATFEDGSTKEFPADIDMVPAEVGKALQPLFAHFAESIRLAENRQKKRANMTFTELAENFGFRKK